LLKERPFGEEVVMTAQHAPHTPLWRRFLSLPHTRLGWWAVGLASLVLSLTLIDLAIDLPRSVVLETILLITAIVAALAGGVVGALALGSGERSLLVWGSLVPATIFFAVLTSIFQEGSFWVNGSPGVLFWAVIATSIIFLRSRERSS
jgi:hypothetical protein